EHQDAVWLPAKALRERLSECGMPLRMSVSPDLAAVTFEDAIERSSKGVLWKTVQGGKTGCDRHQRGIGRRADQIANLRVARPKRSRRQLSAPRKRCT